MPELPDIELYVHCLRRRVMQRRLEQIAIFSPFLLRTFEPAPSDLEGRRVVDVRRLGKRIIFGFEGELFAIIHLMIAGRLRWREGNATRISSRPAKIELARLQFESGRLTLTEASQKKRAAMHIVRGKAALAAHDPGGIEVLASSIATFAAVLRAENHTVKRTLTDPRAISGIGNAYSDEILHRARLSPLLLTQRMNDDEMARLHNAAGSVLSEWSDRLRARFADRFPAPGEITAFRPEFAVHGKYGQACPDCGATVQRIVHGENETNYCPRCQTGGKLLADRSLSRLLKADWPRSIEQLE